MTSSAAALQPFCFGPAARRMFGILHSPVTGAPAKAAVLLFKPFGQEAVRSHRMLKVLSERLAQAGQPTLRFDYFGTGDSMGDDLDGDIDGWIGDALTADAELRRRSGATHVVWIGMRLGANLALQAAQRASAEPARIVLWDPVVDGREYLAALRRQHAFSLDYAMGGMPTRHATALLQDGQHDADGYLGFAVSSILYEQLIGFRLSASSWARRPLSTFTMADLSTQEGLGLLAALPAEPGVVEVIDLRHGIDWTTDTAEGTLISVPALERLLRLAGEPAE